LNYPAFHYSCKYGRQLFGPSSRWTRNTSLNRLHDISIWDCVKHTATGNEGWGPHCMVDSDGPDDAPVSLTCHLARCLLVRPTRMSIMIHTV